MRVFFALLLIANIAFAVFQWLLPYEQLFVEQKKVPAAEQLQLLTDANTQVVSEAEVVAKVEARVEAEIRSACGSCGASRKRSRSRALQARDRG